MECSRTAYFFSRQPESDSDFSAVFPVERSAEPSRIGTVALQQLISGPTLAERDAGFFSELGGMLAGPSTCDGPDFTLAIIDGVATVTFCRAIASAGTGQNARVRSQIDATLRQFPTVERVRVLNADGHCLFDASGLDLCLSSDAVTAEHALAEQAPTAERTLMDMQVWLVPPQSNGYCVELEGGTIVVDLQAVGQGSDGADAPWPVDFTFYGYRGFDATATIDTTLTTLEPTHVSQAVQAGCYCVYLHNAVRVAPDASNAEVTRYWQGVEVRIRLQPAG